MSVHVEWMSTKYLTVGIIGAGAQWDGEIVGPDSGEDVIGEGNVGLVLGEDDVTIVEGTPTDLRVILTRALALLDKVENEALPELDPLAADLGRCVQPIGDGQTCGGTLALCELEGVIRTVDGIKDGTLYVHGETEGADDGTSNGHELYCRSCLTAYRLPESIEYV